MTLLVLLAAGLLISVFALYSFGRFRPRARDEHSHALPVEGPRTSLDELVAPMEAQQPGRNGLMLLADNLDAFAIRVLAARRAGRSLDLQYYIWKDDLTGRLLAREMLTAADRGVRVRLLLDDINAQGFDRTYLALDAHPNIAVHLFNPSRNREGPLRRGLEMLLRAFSITRRMHNKAWIADGRLVIVGGRNVGDAYFDAAEKSNFRDLDLLLVGPAVRQAEAVFDDFWNSSAVIPIAALGKVGEDDLAKLRASLESATADELAKPYLKRVAEDETVIELLAGDWRLHWTAEVRILSDPPEKVKGKREDGWIINDIRSLIGSAVSAVELVSPYFIPGTRGTSMLVELAQRGVRVSVLTNSLAATDVAAVHGAYAGYRRALVEGGVGLFELKPYDRPVGASLFGSSSAASLHTKAFTIDGRLGFVGSMNFDPRSIFLNSEMGVVFEHRELVEEIRALFADETSPQKSYRVEVDGGRVVWRDMAGGLVSTLRKEPQAGLWRRTAATIIGLLPIQSQL